MFDHARSTGTPICRAAASAMPMACGRVSRAPGGCAELKYGIRKESASKPATNRANGTIFFIDRFMITVRNGVIPSREDSEESPEWTDKHRTCDGDPSRSAALGMTSFPSVLRFCGVPVSCPTLAADVERGNARRRLRTGDPDVHQSFQLPRSMGAVSGAGVDQARSSFQRHTTRRAGDGIHHRLHVDVTGFRIARRSTMTSTADRTRRRDLDRGNVTGPIRARIL